jgi:ketosteroid isomerase-like protein
MTQIKEPLDVRAIKALIQTFFDAINDADTKALEATFADPTSTLTIVKQDPPLPPAAKGYDQFASIPVPEAAPAQQEREQEAETAKVVMRVTIDAFCQLIEKGKKKWEGRPDLHIHEQPDLDATGVRVDALFATAWSPFRVTFDGVLHHYGVLVYNCVKVDGGDDGAGGKVWKIEGATQSYRRAPGWEAERDFE